jgi:anti-sigma factor RsiW
VRCRRARALLSDYIDARMPLDGAQAVRGHLDACSRCRGEWQELVALKHVLAAARSPQAPVGFWAETSDRLREQTVARVRRPARFGQRWWEVAWQRAPALAAGLAVILTAILVPLSLSLDEWDVPALDTHAAVAHHVAYAVQFPLTDRRSMDFVVDETRRQVMD